MKLTPHAYQEESIQRMMAEETKAIMVALPMGMGKTLLASEFAIRSGFERVLFIGVKDTFDQWAERLLEQSDGSIVLHRIDATKAGQVAFNALVNGEAGYFFAGSQFLTARDWGHDLQFMSDGSPLISEKTGKQVSERRHLGTYKRMKALDALIVDEVHVFSNRKAVGLRTLRTIKSAWRVGMSGTPAGNKVENLHAITRWLWPDLIPLSYWTWAAEYLTMETTYAAGGRNVQSIVGEKEPGRFVSTLPLYLRAEPLEVAPEPEVVYVDLTPRQRFDYSALESDLLVWLRQHNTTAPLVADLPITLRARLRTATLGVMSFDADGEITFDQDCESSKLTALRGILDYWGNQPVLIYTDSKRFAKVTVARMKAAGYAAVEWSGDVDSKTRAQIKADFLKADGTVNYIVAVISAFSTGLDMFQTVSNKIVWLSESDNNAVQQQALARLFRPGRTLANGGFQHVKIIARDTLDMNVFSRLIAQELSMNAVLRGEKIAA